MGEKFDQRVIDAVRLKGPDALPSAVCIAMDEEDGGCVSLARVMGRLQRLTRDGVLRERMIVDGKGRDRRAYSMGTGRLKRREPFFAWPGRLVPA